jgi:hypothetical protein
MKLRNTMDTIASSVSNPSALCPPPMNTTASSCSQTRSVPIANGMKRTPSELQLSEEEALADYRDYCMFSRIVTGIQCQHRPADSTLNNIIRTRHLPVEDAVCRSYEDDFLKYTNLPSTGATTWMPHISEQVWCESQDRPAIILEQDEDGADEGIFVFDL